MVLQPQNPDGHNRMLGRRISHPSSTNFDDDFESPPSKRFKRLDSNEDYFFGSDSGRESSSSGPARRIPREIPDSQSEDDDDYERPPSASQQTDLESTLPPLKNDKEAIAEYEAEKAAESADPSAIHPRSGQEWVRGKSSIYVDAFNLALDTVLEDEGHLFDEAETAVFNEWKQLEYEAQYLYVRLFLRKTAAWHRISGLRYHGDIGNMPIALGGLYEQRTLPKSTASTQKHPGEVEQPRETSLEGSFTFADGSDKHITTLEDASSLLKLDELKDLAKDAKVQGKNKHELLQALRKASGKQSGLAWRAFKRSDTEDSIKSEDGGGELDGVEKAVTAQESIRVNRDSHFVQRILSSTGPCIRLSSVPLKLFERVHLVFYRSTEWTEKSLTTIILARISRRNFPNYIVSRSANIFADRPALLEFEASIRTQFHIDNILEFNGTVTKDGLVKVKEIFEEVYPRWLTLVKEEQRKEDRVYESEEGAYLRRFSPAWVYTRIMHKGAYVLGRFKEHKREHQMLLELLDQRLFHAARRGAWYQRKALLEEHYMWALEPVEGRSEEAQKKYWKNVALQTCEEGLQDRDCHLIYHYDLQKRVMKLEKALKVAKRQQHDFGHVKLVKPVERIVKGVRIEKEFPLSRNGHRRDSDTNTSRRGGKTIWVDEREGGGECSVEAMCLSWYRDQGWKGYHSEGGVVRTLFGFLFYDVLFTYVPNVFQTPYQTCPLDLHTDAFYPSRASEINRRLVEISNGEGQNLLREVYSREADKQTCVVGVNWAFAFDELVEIISCFQGAALATICKVMAQEYQQRGGGIPDLFLWHAENKEVMFSEVKSENDRLSDTQRLWIHVLTGAGIKVELCNAVAEEVRVKR